MLYCQKTYNDRLSKTLDDKLFFLAQVPDAISFIDIGCADGALGLGIHAHLDRHYHYIGYDISEEQIAAARLRHKDVNAASFFHNIADVITARKKQGGIACVILSSVIHEIMSQRQNWDHFLDIIDSLDCKYIAIRDMAVARETYAASSSLQDRLKIMRFPGIDDRLQSFTARWGDIAVQANLVHFLLKYRWVANWANELEENYIPVSSQDWLTLFRPSYRPVYFQHASLPHIQDVVRKDFGIELHDHTHIKMILQR